MNNDQRIAEQLDHLGHEIAYLTDSARSLRELRDDMTPRVNQAVKILIAELAKIQSDFQLEDVLDLVKNLMRNIRNLTWSVDQLKNLIDFLRTIEPLLKSSVPQAIHFLDGLEQKGVFRIGAAMLGAMQRIADMYTAEEIEQIAESMVHLAGIVRKLTAPDRGRMQRQPHLPRETRVHQNPEDVSVTRELALAHGPTAEEYDRIIRRLGREPTFTELGLFSALWSEHCAYKHSRVFLRGLPTTAPHVLQGPGENPGIVDVGDGLALTFKIESHNHPSFIEPFQGAATGVGGILRDIFTMGARPIAVLDSLRSGDPRARATRRLIEGVVSGIGRRGSRTSP